MSAETSSNEHLPFAGSVKRARHVVAATTLALLAMMPVVAHAAPPDHQPPSNNPPYDLVLDAGRVPCGAITITFTDNERYTTFSNGVVLVTGRLGAVVTSEVTGKSVDLKVSGPGKIFTDGSLVGGGNWLLFDTEILAFATGRISIPASGRANDVTVNGRRTDLCPLLGL